MPKLVLGTANFGMPYGPNKYQVPPAEIEDILITAEDNSLTIDTAAAYGNAENIVSDYPNNVITKLKPWSNENEIINQIYNRIDNFKQDKLFGLLIHSEQQIYDLKLLTKLVTAKRLNLVENIGISVYDPEIALIAAKMGFDIIQIPFNVFDSSLYHTDFFDTTRKNGTKVYARTAFLQGYLSNPIKYGFLDKEWPNFTKNYKKLEKIAKKYGFSVPLAALAFNASIPGIDHIVVGVDSAEQLIMNLEFVENLDWCSLMSKGECMVTDILYEFKNVQYQIPSLWKEKK